MIESPFAVLARALAQDGEPTHLLPSLHQYLVRRTGCLCSVLLETDPETGDRVGTSGYGAFPGGVRLTGTDARALGDLVSTGSPVAVRDLGTRCPALARGLAAPAALIAPVPRQDAPGLLAIGFAAEAAPPELTIAAEAASAFAVTLEWMRLRRASELQRRLREVVLAFSRGASSSGNLAAGFEALCLGVNAVFGARRSSIWMHDRRGRQIVLEGSSDSSHLVAGGAVPADAPLSPVAHGLRLDRPEFVPDPDAARDADRSVLLVPLRGRRRALGTLVLEDLQGSPAERGVLVEAARDLGRQLSSVIDSVQLLTDVLRSRRELEDTFNSLADLVAVCDGLQRIIYANQAFAARVGRSLDQLRDQPFADFAGPELAAWVAAQAPRTTSRSRTAPTRQLDDPVLRGIFSVTVTSLISQDQRHLGTVVVARDVTEQARLETERAALRQQLAQSEKLAALGQFVAGIAHELNNPLQGVLGHLELMKATGKLTPSQRRDVRLIYREADRAAKIVSSLLVFAGSGQRQRRRCSLNALVARALALRAARLRKAGIEVVKRLDKRQPRLVGDPLLLQQVFFNIILNAEQAMIGRPGRLEVSSTLRQNGEWVVLRIRDTGPGLSDTVLARAFEPFFTTKEVGTGTGLGLAITYGIIQDHSGQIRAENHPQGGALFTVELPTDKLVIK